MPVMQTSNRPSSSGVSTETRKRVSYFYDAEIGNYHFGQGHPMKPHRVRITHALVVNYGLYKKMDVFRPRIIKHDDITAFHSDGFADFLRTVTPDNMVDYQRHLQKYDIGESCPVFDGLYEYCQLYAGGSVGGAARLNEAQADIVINWAGGMHNPKQEQASGFGYVNDCVLAILELLKKHERVLYIDMDIHHGDGVEEAFYTSPRVMTISFHKFGDFFPGTGDILDTGYLKGENYAINVPLKEGISDGAYVPLFKTIVGKAVKVFSPRAVVLQCGANSLSGDPLGCFNLSTRGHGECVRFVRDLNVPLLVLGGGGYSLRTVPRCWAYETAILAGEAVGDDLPFNDYYEYFGPDYKLHPPVSNMEDTNTKEYLSETTKKVLSVLKRLEPLPSVPLQTGQRAGGVAPMRTVANAGEMGASNVGQQAGAGAEQARPMEMG